MKFNKNNMEIFALMFSATGLMVAMFTMVIMDKYTNYFEGFAEVYSLDLAMALVASTICFSFFEIIRRRNGKKYIFVSYSIDDKEIVEKVISGLNKYLKKKSKYRFEILTIDSVILGDNIFEAIKIFLRKADEAIIFVSSSYYESEWCKMEFNEIYASKKKVIPIIMEPDADLGKLPKDISYIKALDLYGYNSEEEFEKKIALLAKDIVARRIY